MTSIFWGTLLIIAGFLIAIFAPGAISALGGIMFAVGVIVIGISIYNSSQDR